MGKLGKLGASVPVEGAKSLLHQAVCEFCTWAGKRVRIYEARILLKGQQIQLGANRMTGFPLTSDSQESCLSLAFLRDGVKLVVDKISLGFVKGATVDFVEELIRSAFQISSHNLDRVRKLKSEMTSFQISSRNLDRVRKLKSKMTSSSPSDVVIISAQEKTSFNDDGESGRLLLMLGQVQLKLQKLVDSYVSACCQAVVGCC
ncbi:hypothetical protein LguiB_031438 [Lonicera macranthoides]